MTNETNELLAFPDYFAVRVLKTPSIPQVLPDELEIAEPLYIFSAQYVTAGLSTTPTFLEDLK
ncbi:hypothetical protein CMUS01_11485 [Colletotrichum musicola]|uniref:Uncharacterized protein n=1 Tax=Colletotrichum musicola TaxID=2175873 RepID=A0A8H6N5F5_9PEZI|nr:hypothetical protein CMUS01_11485 [Colletotrichum musicola]